MTTIKAPGLRMLLGEARAPVEIASFLLRARSLRGLPRGDGHAVMFLPGFGMTDEAFAPMASAVARLGYATCGWEQGLNLGLRTQVAERLLERVLALREQHRATVSLVGWSAGGLYAREVARARPDAVRRIFTLGSPIRAHESGQELVEFARSSFEAYLAQRGRGSFVPAAEAPPVACTAIHSKRDGVVAWRAALEADAPHTENLEVESSHIGLGFSIEVLRILAQRLAVPASG